MKQHYFVTGTDTDVGKTVCCAALLQSAQQQGFSTLAYKPIAAGCEVTEQGLRNEDALILQKNSNVQVNYDLINPVSFKDPIAPHIAAALENQPISTDVISHGMLQLKQQQANVLIIEGAGGWHLPINNEQLLSQWVKEQQLSVILVVGMKLGCLNHAMLTYQAIINDGLKVTGWIANQLSEQMPFYAQNLQWLKQKIDAPLIAEIPTLEKPTEQDLSHYVNFKFNDIQ